MGGLEDDVDRTMGLQLSCMISIHPRTRFWVARISFVDFSEDFSKCRTVVVVLSCIRYLDFAVRLWSMITFLWVKRFSNGFQFRKVEHWRFGIACKNFIRNFFLSDCRTFGIFRTGFRTPSHCPECENQEIAWISGDHTSFFVSQTEYQSHSLVSSSFHIYRALFRWCTTAHSGQAEKHSKMVSCPDYFEITKMGAQTKKVAQQLFSNHHVEQFCIAFGDLGMAYPTRKIQFLPHVILGLSWMHRFCPEDLGEMTCPTPKINFIFRNSGSRR